MMHNAIKLLNELHVYTQHANYKLHAYIYAICVGLKKTTKVQYYNYAIWFMIQLFNTVKGKFPK